MKTASHSNSSSRCDRRDADGTRSVHRGRRRRRGRRRVDDDLVLEEARHVDDDDGENGQQDVVEGPARRPDRGRRVRAADSPVAVQGDQHDQPDTGHMGDGRQHPDVSDVGPVAPQAAAVASVVADITVKQYKIVSFFNARTQRSWRRRLWDRLRTPPSRRRERLDTIRARITKFGPEVELNERCSDTKFDVTGYFRSPASGHFVNYFSNFWVQYLRNG